MASDPYYIIGLMSGSSVDGVDAALVDVQGQSVDLAVEVLAHASYPYQSTLRDQLLTVSDPETSSVDLICHLNVALGHCFADAAFAVAKVANIPLNQVDLIGSHGQTIYHIPEASDIPPRHMSTLQIGEPSIIAERTGATTVADFRPRDMAAGGLGAPLSPYGHYILFATHGQPKLIQNIGGIGNVTVLTGQGLEQTIAFDTGPGNMVIDEAVHDLTAGRLAFDVDGRMAAKGQVDQGLLNELLQHPFVTQSPPKATGRETFGKHFFQHFFKRSTTLDLSADDVVATCTAYTAETIRCNYQSFILPHWPITEVVVCGGGAQNPTLMRMLAATLPTCRLTTPAVYGYPNEALEAILFALLAYASINGQPNSLPSVTGARHPVILGIEFHQFENSIYLD